MTSSVVKGELRLTSFENRTSPLFDRLVMHFQLVKIFVKVKGGRSMRFFMTLVFATLVLGAQMGCTSPLDSKCIKLKCSAFPLRDT